MTEALIEGERMRQELEMAREVQMSTLPSAMPPVPGYDLFGTSRPAEQTGGDTFDMIPTERGLVVVLGDATGHGIAPALSVTQMQAMLRMAFRLGADLPTAFRHVNDQLAATLADDRFVTAFVGVLDPLTHRFEFHSGGQARSCTSRQQPAHARRTPDELPLGAMPLAKLRPSVTLDMRPGDVVLLITDGVYEYHDPDGEGVRRRSRSKRSRAATARGRWRSWRAHPRRRRGVCPRGSAAGRRHTGPGGAPRLRRWCADLPAASMSCPPCSHSRRPSSPNMMSTLRLLSPVDFAIEELFTNMVKYGRRAETRSSWGSRRSPGESRWRLPTMMSNRSTRRGPRTPT